MKPHGIFLTFEGGEGSGKTTQMEMLGKTLQDRGLNVVVTREPGGTRIGREIRKILLHGDHQEIHPLTELMLYAADRAQHVYEVLAPCLARGEVLLCDRYLDSTLVYQGEARGLDKTWIDTLGTMATQGLKPDGTFLLDCPPEIGLQRSRTRLERQNSSEDRFEKEELEFHEKIRQGYLKLAKTEPERFVILDATRDPEEVHRLIVKSFEERYR